MNKIVTCFVFLMFFSASIIGQSISIEPNGETFVPSASTCQTISVGSVLSFSRAMNCDPYILLSDETGASERDTTFMAPNFDYQFNQEGIYAFFCGAPSTDLAAGIASICYNVIDPTPIPAIGTYGVVLLGIGFIIIALLAFRQMGI